MAFLKSLFGGGEKSSDPLDPVRRSIASQRPPAIGYDFERLATDYILSHVAKNAGAELSDAEVRAEMVADWAERLENIVDAAIIDELARLGKVDEFNRVLDQDDINGDQYLYVTIPNYSDFLAQAVEAAVVKIGGPSGKYLSAKVRG